MKGPRYRTEVINHKSISNKWGMVDPVLLSNALELLLNQYDEEGYSMFRLEWVATGTYPMCLVIFEKYDFNK